MIKEAIDRILSLAQPNIEKFGEVSYSDKPLNLIYPPMPEPVKCSTLEALSDLVRVGLDSLAPADVLAKIDSPTEVSLINKNVGQDGRRRIWASSKYSPAAGFKFGEWHTPENFLVSAQVGFQRVKIQNDDGSFAKDLDYVLEIASKVTADRAVESADDGIAQRVALKQGVSLKGDAQLRGRVNLAPWRTFAEVDQPLSEFLFRARYTDTGVLLALFEADGGRWKLTAVSSLSDWLEKNVKGVTVIS